MRTRKDERAARWNHELREGRRSAEVDLLPGHGALHVDERVAAEILEVVAADKFHKRGAVLKDKLPAAGVELPLHLERAAGTDHDTRAVRHYHLAERLLRVGDERGDVGIARVKIIVCVASPDEQRAAISRVIGVLDIDCPRAIGTVVIVGSRNICTGNPRVVELVRTGKVRAAGRAEKSAEGKVVRRALVYRDSAATRLAARRVRRNAPRARKRRAPQDNRPARLALVVFAARVGRNLAVDHEAAKDIKAYHSAAKAEPDIGGPASRVSAHSRENGVAYVAIAI